jgi:hypothetical protein
MKTSVRPLTAEERQLLEGLRAAPAAGGARFAGFLAFLFTLGVLLIGAPASWQTGIRSLVPAVVALLVGFAVFLRMRRSRRRDPWFGMLDRDLDGGVAQVTDAAISDAIAIEEFEDEGSQYYLRLEDGRVLFLAGQYLYDDEEDGRFPNTAVTVVRAPNTGVVLDFRCTGAPLSASSRRSHFTSEEHADGHVPEDGAILDVDFESLRSRP